MTRADAIRELTNSKIEISPLNRAAMIDELALIIEDIECGYAPQRWVVEAGALVSAIFDPKEAP